MNQSSRLASFLRNIAVFLLSSGIGLIFTIALVALADLRGWCCVNSVTFQEGGLVGIFMLFGLATFHILRRRWAFFRDSHSREFGWLAHVSYICSALGAWPPVRIFIFEKWIVTAGLVCAVLGTIVGAVALVARLRGRIVPHIGLSIIGILVGALWTHRYLFFRLLA
jgi:hypothetical protein